MLEKKKKKECNHADKIHFHMYGANLSAAATQCVALLFSQGKFLVLHLDIQCQW
jgi:hypothetical protein